jgi:hypothetical protein
MMISERRMSRMANSGEIRSPHRLPTLFPSKAWLLGLAVQAVPEQAGGVEYLDRPDGGRRVACVE